MMNGFNSGFDIVGGIQRSKFDLGFSDMPAMKTNSIDSGDGVSFKGVMSGLADNLNKELNAPDQLLKDAMTGSNDVDIHDVMTAMAKAELSVNVATQVTSKVIQAYDKIMQIQV